MKRILHLILRKIFGSDLTKQSRVCEGVEKASKESLLIQEQNLEKELANKEKELRAAENILLRKTQLAQRAAELAEKKEKIEKIKQEKKIRNLEAREIAKERARLKIEEQKNKKKKTDLKKWQDNAFLRGRAAWNDMYGSVVDRNRKYFAVSVLLSLALIAAVIGIAYIGSQSKIQPFMVQVGQNGEIVDVSEADKAPDITEKIIKYFLQRFIINMHSISGDNIVEKRMLAFVYSSVNTAGNANAMNVLKNYIQLNNPFVLNNQFTNQVNIETIYPVSKNTYHISWEEIKRTIDGKLVTKNYYTGQFTYKIAPSTGENFTYNPFGIYITNMAWSQVQTDQDQKS